VLERPVTTPLVLERLVRHTPAKFLFVRPALFRIASPREKSRPQPAE